MIVQQLIIQKFIEQDLDLTDPNVRTKLKIYYKDNPCILMVIDNIEKAEALEYNPSFKTINKQIDSLYKSIDWK